MNASSYRTLRALRGGFASAAILLLATLATAQSPATFEFIAIPSGTLPNEPAPNSPGNYPADELGQTFIVGGTGIWVTSLGAYDADNPSSFASNSIPVQVGIYALSGTNAGQLVTPVANFTGAGSGVAVGDVLYQSITPVFLSPGTYVVAASGYGGANTGYEGLGNTAHPPYFVPPWSFNTGGGAITPGGAPFLNSQSLVYPIGYNVAGNAQPQWAAGNFQFQTTQPPSATDTPAMPLWALITLGAVLAIVGVRFLPREGRNRA
jgi:hypothetical protein